MICVVFKISKNSFYAIKQKEYNSNTYDLSFMVAFLGTDLNHFNFTNRVNVPMAPTDRVPKICLWCLQKTEHRFCNNECASLFDLNIALEEVEQNKFPSIKPDTLYYSYPLELEDNEL